MDESWDVVNFEPKLPTGLKSSNKWEGEDEEEIVKESWEDEEEEKKDKEKLPPPPPKTKKKIHNKMAEKERLQREKAERLAAERVSEVDITSEQKLADKIWRQKLQEESDLRLAMETCGITDGSGGKIDNFEPTSKEEFEEFAGLLVKKITQYKARGEYPEFTDEIVRSIVAQMSSLYIRRIKLTVDNLCIEKQKAEKNEKGKKPTKGKGKAKLKVERANAHLTQYDAYDNYETDFDDFM